MKPKFIYLLFLILCGLRYGYAEEDNSYPFSWSYINEPCNNNKDKKIRDKVLSEVKGLEDRIDNLQSDEIKNRVTNLINSILKLSPKCKASTHILYLKANLYSYLEEYNEVEKILKHLITKFNDEPRLKKYAYFDLATTYSKLYKFRKAISYYIKLLKEFPLDRRERAIILGNIGETWMALKEMEKGEFCLNYSIELWREHSGAWWAKAVLKDKLGYTKQSIEIAKEALQIGMGIKELTRSDVFYIPPEEKYYFLALGYEAKEEFSEAYNYWLKYLNETKDVEWKNRAIYHLNYLKKYLKK